MRALRIIRFAIATIGLSFSVPARGQNIALTWSGQSGDFNWTTSGNWNLTSTGTPANVYPNNDQPAAGNTYDVTLNGYVTQNIGITINNLTFNGGTISTGNVFVISKFINWNGGTMSGGGQLTIDGGANITGSVFISIPVIAADHYTGLPVNITVSGAVPIYSDASAVWSHGSWINLSPSTFTFLSDGSLLNNTAAGTFDNSTLATFQKTGGSGTSTVAWNFQNHGTVNVSSGTLAFTGTYADDGYVTVGNGATVQYNGPNTLPGAITVGTGGRVQFNGPSTWMGTARSSGLGSVAFLSNTANFSGTNTLASSVTVAAGVTLDGSGALTISGPLTWNGGNMGAPSSPGAGTTTLSGGATINGSAFLNRTVTNASGSMVTVTAAGSLYSNSANAAWTNQAGSAFNFTADGGLAVNAGVGAFTNDSGATFAKTGGAGATNVAWAFTNNGTVFVSAGTLSFAGSSNVTNYSGGTLTGGTWRVLAGSTLDLGSSRPVTTIAPGTTVELNGAGSTFNAIESHLTANAGDLNIVGGRSFTAGGMLANTGLLTVGPVAGDGSLVKGAVVVNSGGVLRGNGTLTGEATLGAGGVVTPGLGSTVGTLAVGGWNAQPGGTYLLKYNPGTTTPVAGADNDTIASTFGLVDLSGLSSTNKMTVNLEPSAGRTPAGSPVTYTAATFSSVILPGGISASNLTGLFNFVGNFSGTPTASLDESQTRLQFTFTPVVVTGWTWNGGTSGSWNDFRNWNPGVTPATGSSTQITFGATVNPAMTNDSPGMLTVNALTFTTAAPAYTLTGNGLNLQSNGSTAPQIFNNSASALTIAVPLFLTNNLTVGGNGNSTLTGPVSGGGSLTLVGPGTLTLSGANTYAGGTNVQNNTVIVTAGASLGTGPLTGTAQATVNFTGTVTVTNAFAMNGGTIAVAAGQTVTFNGGPVSGAFLDGSGTFATSVNTGETFVNVTTSPAVAIVSNSAADQFVHFTNSGSLNVAPGVNTNGASTTVNLNGFTNQGTGSVTVGAASQINVANFQSYGTINLTVPTDSSQTTLLTNLGNSPLGLNGGSRTFVGKPGATTLAGLDLHGQNMIVTDGLFVNNGFVSDSTGGSQVIVDYGALYKGAGQNFVPIVTQNGGKFQAGNSPGKAQFSSLTIGPGGINDFLWQINDAGPSSAFPTAPGVAGPSANGNNQVSGWGLMEVDKIADPLTGILSSGNLTWTATSQPGSQFVLNLETLLGPYTDVGTDNPGPMSDFDPDGYYWWPIIRWQGTYAGPTDGGTLTADTLIDTSQFQNTVPINRFPFEIVYDGYNHSLDLVMPVPEPSTLLFTGFSGIGLGWVARRRRAKGI